MLATRRTVLLATLAPALLVAAALLAGHTPPARADAGPAPRYLLAQGKQRATSECLYVLDVRTSRLSALRMDGFTRKVEPFTGIDVSKDFEGEETPDFAMRTVLHNEALALLYLVDQRSGRLRVYGANEDSRAVERLDGIDLKTLK